MSASGEPEEVPPPTAAAATAAGRSQSEQLPEVIEENGTANHSGSTTEIIATEHEENEAPVAARGIPLAGLSSTAVDQTNTETSVVDETDTESSTVDEVNTENSVTDKTDTENSAADKTGTENSVADKTGTENSAADKTGAENSVLASALATSLPPIEISELGTGPNCPAKNERK